MRLKPIYPQKPEFFFCCIRCGDRTSSKAEAGSVADLDGMPFRAYYCGPCAHIRREERKAAGFSNAPIIEQR